MPIRFLDEQPKTKIRFLDEEPKGTMAAEKTNAPSGVLMGLTDVVAGAGQLVPRAIEQITSLGGLAPNPVSEAYKSNYENLTDPYARKREEDYQLGRKESGRDGFDYGRVVGNVINPINYVGGAGMVPTLARGAAFGALQPVEDTENYGSQKAMQIGAGVLGAGVGKAIGDKVAAPITRRAADVASLLKEKIPLTLGQRHGGIIKAMEDKAMSVPIVGDAIRGAQVRANDALNRAAYSRVLKNIDKKLPNDVNVGNEGVDYVSRMVGEAYDDLLPKLTGKLDDTFIEDLNNLKNMVKLDDVMEAAEKNKFSKILKETVENRFSGKGVTGQGIKDIESSLGAKAAAFGTGSPSQRQLADALKETVSTMRKSLERTNPEYAAELKNVNKAYSELLRVQGAAKGAKADGVFNPNQFQTAIRQLDPTKRKSGFSRGNAQMQDLGGAAQRILPNNVPNSGTADRLMANALLLGGAGSYGAGELSGNDMLKYGALLAAPAALYSGTGVKAANIASTGLGKALSGVGKVAPYVGAPLSNYMLNNR